MVNAQSTAAPSTLVEEVQSVAESEEAQFAEKEDYGYELGSDTENEDDGQNDDGVDLGAEDGEEPWQMGDLHTEGYDNL